MTNSEFENSDSSATQVFIFILSILVLFHSLVWIWLNSYFQAIPLFDFYTDQIRNILFPQLSLVLILLHLLRKRDLYFALGFVLMFLQIVTGFSRINLATPMIMLLIIFYFLFGRKSETQNASRTGAIALTSFIMLFSAIQKMNPDYLGGAEFRTGGNFMSEIYNWNLPQIGEFLSGLSFLPEFSIAIEYGLAVAIWFYPAAAVHTLLLFFLFLSFLRPGIIIVYLVFLAITSLVTSEAVGALRKLQISNSIWSVILISPLLQLLLNQDHNLIYKMMVNFPISIFLIFIHGNCLISAIKLIRFGTPFESSHVTQWRVWIVPIFLFLIYLCSDYFVPKPLAFNMFNSRNFAAGGYLLEISSESVCKSFSRRWPRTPVSDTEFKKQSSSDCYYKFPTRSGLEYLSRQICKIDANAKLKLGPLNESTQPILCAVSGH